jgi:acetylornithine deacetylase
MARRDEQEARAVLEAIRGRVQRDRVSELLVEAVNHYSPSYAEEPATRVFAHALENAGLPYERQPVAGGVETGGQARANLVVRLGPMPPALLWLGHVDTVAAQDEGHAHAQIEGDVLSGLGAADMKSGCAAAVEAVRALAEAGVTLKRGLCLGLVVGEEEYGDGTETLLETVEAPLAIVGEPTDLRPSLRHFGYVECDLMARGARAHAALPEAGSSAIHAMMEWLLRIVEARRELDEPERVAFNPREIQGGSEMFAVAERCTASLDVHIAPGLGPEVVDEVIDSARRVTLEKHPGCQLSYTEEFSSLGYDVPEDHPLIEPVRWSFEQLQRSFGPTIFRSQSDATYLYKRGTIPVVCGPGRLEEAHTAHESVRLAQVEEAARLYAAIFYAACGS